MSELPASAGIPRAPSVLVVEDHMESRIFLDAALQEQFEVVAVPRAGEAVQQAKARSFDIFVLDIALGTADGGIDLLHTLRALPSHRHVPALAVTAYDLPRSRERCLEAGFDAYLCKPFFQEDILRAVGRLLERTPRREAPGNVHSE